MANQALAFVRRTPGSKDIIAVPPLIERASPGGYVLFMDENEIEVLWAKSWPYTTCPIDEQTNSTTWKIDGQIFTPSHLDRSGDWIFRRSPK